MKVFLKNLTAIFFGLVIAAGILEIFLRIYNPIPMRIKGNDIVLPTNLTYTIKNDKIPQLDPIIKHTKNSLGFRGEEIPENFNDYLSIIVVGGSTAEDYYLSDDKTWPAVLEKKLSKDFPKVWVNNAGFDGHSTFGHQLLLDKYIVKIKPKVVIYLVGVNDIGRKDLNFGFDNKLLKNSYTNWMDFAAKKSELLNFVMNIARAIKARQYGVGHGMIDLRTMEKMNLTDDYMNSELEKQKVFVDGFYNRLSRLIATTKENGMEPILLTQPLLWGNSTDLSTGVNLEDVKIDNIKNGKLYWRIMEMYNDQTRRVAKENGIFVVDLATKMPKDSLYFYDGMHYTNEGAQKIADITSEELIKHFKK